MAGLVPAIHVPNASKWTAGEAKRRNRFVFISLCRQRGDLGLVVETRGVAGRVTPGSERGLATIRVQTDASTS
jgi:hypothetical protein